jgi:hypothetical protein
VTGRRVRPNAGHDRSPPEALGAGPEVLTTPRRAPPGAPGSLVEMRLTVFWERMRAQFSEQYAESVAKDQVLAALGGRTVNQALADGEDPKTVWRAVCETFEVPERLR